MKKYEYVLLNEETGTILFHNSKTKYNWHDIISVEGCSGNYKVIGVWEVNPFDSIV